MVACLILPLLSPVIAVEALAESKQGLQNTPLEPQRRLDAIEQPTRKAYLADKGVPDAGIPDGGVPGRRA
jgi:hypothetical protein